MVTAGGVVDEVLWFNFNHFLCDSCIMLKRFSSQLVSPSVWDDAVLALACQLRSWSETEGQRSRAGWYFASCERGGSSAHAHTAGCAHHMLIVTERTISRAQVLLHKC